MRREALNQGGWRRHLVRTLGQLTILLTFLASARSLPGESKVATTAGLPTPPAGFSSKATIALAIATGQLKLIENEAEPPSDVRELRDIEYGRIGERALKLDLDLPSQPAPSRRPGLIFIHGGAWSGGERTIYHYYTRRFAQQGYAAATISYRLSKEATFPAAVQDAKCAVRWMRAHADEYQIDPEKIAAIGGSAGGHLAMMVGYSQHPDFEDIGGHNGISSRVQAVVNFYGPFDLTTEEGQKADPVIRFLGGKFSDRPDAYRLASPSAHLDANDPPTLVIHGTIDDVVSIGQADMLVQKLESLHVPFTYARLEGWPHTLDAAQSMNDYCRQRMLDFFQQHLSATSTAPDNQGK